MRPTDAVADPGRSSDARKRHGPRRSSASAATQMLVVGGWRPSDKPGRAFSSLLLGVFDGGKLRYRGRVGAGFDRADQDAIFRQLKAGERKLSPFADAPRDAARAARWTDPKAVVEIRYTELTEEGYFRDPVFLRVCEDVHAVDVAYEKPARSKAEGRGKRKA